MYKRTLTKNDIIQAAKLIAHARATNTVLANLPENIRPQSLAEAYAIQNRLAEQMCWIETGWFCACVNPEIQTQLGLDTPYFGRAVASHQFASPAQIEVKNYPPISLECEFAFRLKHDLPAREKPYRRAEVFNAIKSVHPVIEAVAGYLDDWINQDVFSVIADNGADGPIIYGTGIDNLSDIRLDEIDVRLHVNGKLERIGSGANVGGNPVDALTWLANACSLSGNGLKADYLNNTGTSTGLYPVVPGDEIVADFGLLGQVELTII